MQQVQTSCIYGVVKGKKIQQKIYSKNSIQIAWYLFRHAPIRVITLFSIFPCTIITASCVYLNLKLAWLFFQKLSAKKKIQSSNMILSYSYLNFRRATQTNILHMKFPSQTRGLRQRKTQHSMNIFMAAKKGRSPVSQAAMLEEDRK